MDLNTTDIFLVYQMLLAFVVGLEFFPGKGIHLLPVLCLCLCNTVNRHHGEDPNKADVGNQANFGMPHVTISADLTDLLAAVTEMEVPSFESAGRGLKSQLNIGARFLLAGDFCRVVNLVSRLKIGNI